MQTQDSQKQQNLFITNIIQLSTHNNSKRLSFEPTYKSIENWFQENAKLLNQKKQRTRKHRQRLIQLESQFQKRKGQLQRSLQQKIAHSSQVKSKTLERIQERLHKKSQKIQNLSVKNKIQHEEQIRKKLEERKSFEPEDYLGNSKYSRKSRTSSTDQRASFRIQKTQKVGHDLDRMLYQFKVKQEHAKDMSLQIKKQAAQRARSHNTIEVSDVKHRAQSLKQKEKRLQSLQVIMRLGQLETVRKNKQKLIEASHQRKHKSVSQKISRIKNNLQHLEQERNSKYNQLTQKFEKKIEKRGWREKKKTLNSQRLIQNLQALENEQISKADKIVEKHRQIDQKYRFYKQKKQQLYKTYIGSKDCFS